MPAIMAMKIHVVSRCVRMSPPLLGAALNLTPRARGARLRAGDAFRAGHVAAQGGRDDYRAVALLVVLQDRDQRAADREARAIQRMDVLGLSLVVAEAGLHAPRLEGLHVGARRNLAIGVLAWQPDLEVVGLGGGKAHVARAER